MSVFIGVKELQLQEHCPPVNHYDQGLLLSEYSDADM